jgi:beta-glucanase (GH16 family)
VAIVAVALAVGLAAQAHAAPGVPGLGPWKRDMAPPSTPSNLQVTNATEATVTFAWAAATDNLRVTGYDVYVGSATTPARVTNLNYTVTGLACGTSVDLTVDAYDRAGNRSDPVTARGTTSDCADSAGPSAPANPAITATDTTLALSWDASSDDVGVVGYDVYQGTALVGTPTSTSFALSGLTCGTTYTFSLVAYDAAGNNSTPTTISGTTADCGPTSGTEPSPIAGLGYHQVFRDDFNTLDPSIWDNHIWYDEEANPAWTGFQEVDSSGILHLRTSRDFIGSTGKPYPMNTLTTQTSGLTFDQGYFEARMKWTGGNGAWPAFWLFSYRHATNDAWPDVNPLCALNGLAPELCASAELDAFEGQGSEPQSFYGTIHSNSCDCYGLPDLQNGNNLVDAGLDLTQGFHTYGMLWTAKQITWYLDGKALMSALVYDTTDQPMFLLLQMWTGGWTQDPDATTPDTLETQVDYVQVWQK